MGSGPNFAKLRSAIKSGSVEEVISAMFNLKSRPDRAKTHGENITNETKRALKHLKLSGNMPEKVKTALTVAKERAGAVWDLTFDELNQTQETSPKAQESQGVTEAASVTNQPSNP